jgi:hypothetical protein
MLTLPKINNLNMLKQANVMRLTLMMMIFSPLMLMADEGMWILSMLKELKEKDLKKAGLELNAEDIYSIDKSSLKDAIVHFGGGCTGEMISGEGLLLTNHHCGYSYIQSHSSVEKDYLTKGYWAMNRKEELPCKDLTVTFIISMEEVTAKVLEGISDTAMKRDLLVAEKIKQLEAEANKNVEYKSFIRGFFGDNRYFMFVTQTFRDVRLVGAPPSSIGKFGSDTDNWMWPRHTGDFCLFRVYASKDNRPADYSEDNQPYQPKHFLPISLKDLKEDDFTMVIGFPGRTQEYLSSWSVDLIRNETDPNRVKVRDRRLAVLDREMRSNDTIRIRYAAKYASVSNAWKKWIGEMRGIDRTDILNRKREEEQRILREHGAARPAGIAAQDILTSLESTVKAMRPLSRKRDFYQEAFLGCELLNLGTSVANMMLKWEETKADDATKEKDLKILMAAWPGFYKNYHRATDELVMSSILPLFIEVLDAKERQDFFGKDISNPEAMKKWIRTLHAKTMFSSLEKANQDAGDSKAMIKRLSKDPVVKLCLSVTRWFNASIKPGYAKAEAEHNRLQRLWLKTRMEIEKDRVFYSDANSTMRLTYGKVKPYRPYDGARYHWYTTLEGVMEKENPSLDEFVVDERLKEAFRKKDYGSYADGNGELRVAFIATNHTTGGNSGSPVLNSKGQFIGINFDRNWEGTMSDIVYDPERVRNIICDAHYILFVIDKVGGAGYLLREMKILRE